MFWMIVAIFALMLTIWWCLRYNLYWKIKGVPTIKESSIKQSLDIMLLRKPFWKTMEDLYWGYNEKFVGFFMLNTPSLFIKDVDLIKRILVKDFEYFPDRTLGRNTWHDKLGAEILFLIRGYWWKFMRSKVAQAYSTSRINLQIPIMEKVAEDLCKYVAKQEGQKLDIKETAAKYSTDVITAAAYGIDGKSFTGDKDNYRLISARIFSAETDRALAFALHYVAPFLIKLFPFMVFLDLKSNKRLEKIYFEQMKVKDKTGVNNNDFLDFIRELCKKETHPAFEIHHKAMVSQAAQYFLAGYETIGSTLCYILYELAKHPQIQATLRDEIENVMKNHDGVLSTTALKEMTYLDMVLRETMRYYPVLPFLDRKVAKDYKIPNTNVTIEKGTNVYMSTIGMHHDPKFFPEPEKFDPERFSPGNKIHIDPFCYLPVGSGPRMCIGARFGYTTIKVGVVRLLLNFNVTTTPQTPEKITFVSSFILVPSSEINLCFTKI